MSIQQLNNLNLKAGLEADGDVGSAGQVLSSTGPNGVEWINQSAITASSDFIYYEVKNETGSTILKGKGIMAVGTDGNSGHILVDEMVADGTIAPRYFLGVLETSVDNGGFARVIAFGELDQFNTNGQNGETWSNGQVLWCDPDSPGDFTIIEPLGPNVKIPAAFVLKASTQGKIQVRVQANEGVKDLYDTKIDSQVDGDVLVWDNTTGVWFNNDTLSVKYSERAVAIGDFTPPISGKLQISNEATDIWSTLIQLNSTGTQSRMSINNNGTGDSQINFQLLGSSKFTLGVDNSDSDKFKISGSSVLGSNDRLVIDSSGNVGIGTTSPSRALEINTTGSNNYQFRIGTNAYYYDIGRNTSNGFLNFYGNQSNASGFVFETVNGERMRIDHDGDVGIGTNAPTQKLHVDGNARVTGAYYDSNNAPGTSGQILSSTATGTNWISGSAIPGVPDGSGTTNYLARWTDADTLGIGTTYDNGTNVGIGTTSPETKLDVIGGSDYQTINIGESKTDNDVKRSGITFTHYDTDQPEVTLINSYIDSNISYVSIGGSSAAQVATENIRFFTAANTTTISGTERMRINSSGNVGIGTTSPSYKLDVSGNARVTGAYYDSNNSPGTSGQVLSSTASGTDWISIENLGTFLDIIDVSEPGNTTAEWSLIKTLPASDANQRDTLFIKIVGGGWNDNMRYEAEITLSNRDGFNYFWDVKGGSEYSTGGNGSNRLRVVAYSQTDGTVDVYLYKTSYMTGWIYATFQNTGAPEIIASLGSPTTTQPSGTEVFTTYGNTYPANIAAVNNRVGIGTTSPGEKLSVEPGADVSAEIGRAHIGNVGYAGYAGFSHVDRNSPGDYALLHEASGQTYLNARAAQNIRFRINNTDQMILTSGGKFGVGTTSPGEKLTVKGTDQYIAVEQTTYPWGGTNTLGLKMGTNGVSGLLDWRRWTGTGTDHGTAVIAQVNSDGGYGLDFRVDNQSTNTPATTSRMFLSSSGEVGIGTTSPSTKLHVFGTTSSIPALGAAPSAAHFGASAYGTLFSTLPTGRGVIQQGRVDGTATSYDLLLQPSGGNVAIGLTSATQKLHVGGSILATGAVYSGSTTHGFTSFYGSTDIQTSSGGSVLVRNGFTYRPIQASAFTVSSDYRLKSNITPLENAIDRLNQLNVHRFNWNDRLDEPKVDGFIAHEVSPIIPEAVLGEKDEVYEDGTPKHQGIDQAKIVPLLTAALQEAILKIEQLETRIQTLENN